MNRNFTSILSLGLIISSIILGSFFYKAQKSVRTVRVVGSANQLTRSDILKWQITLGAFAQQNNLNQAYRSLNQNIIDLRNFFGNHNLNTKDLSINPAYSYPIYDTSGSPKGYNIDQMITFTCKDSSQFSAIEELGFNPSELYDKNLQIRNSQIQYYLASLPELKKLIIAEATKDARSRAEQVASSSKAKIGKLLNARVGVFQITEPYSTDVQSYGIYNTSSKNKQISVTVTCEFELK